MKRIMFFLLFVIGMIATTLTNTSCGDEINVYGDTLYFEFNYADSSKQIAHVTQSQNQLQELKDSSQVTARSYSDPEVHVEGSNAHVDNTTNVNAGDGGGNGDTGSEMDKSQISIPSGYTVYCIPINEVELVYEFNQGRNAGIGYWDLKLFTPKENEKPIGYFTTTQDGWAMLLYTTILRDVYLSGANEDPYTTVYSLEITNTRASTMLMGTPKYGYIRDAVASVSIGGIDPSAGNDPFNPHPRTLLGTDGKYLYLCCAQSANSRDAYHTFANMGLCDMSQIILVQDGEQAAGETNVALALKVDEKWEL